MGFLKFIQLGSQVYNGAFESVQACTMNNLTSFQFVQMFLKITGIRGCTFALQRGAKYAPPFRNAGFLRAEIDTFRFGGISEVHSAWESSLQWCH